MIHMNQYYIVFYIVLAVAVIYCMRLSIIDILILQRRSDWTYVLMFTMCLIFITFMVCHLITHAPRW